MRHAILLVLLAACSRLGPDPVAPPADVADPDLRALLVDLAAKAGDAPAGDARAKAVAKLAMAYDANGFNASAEECYRRALAVRADARWWYGLAFVLERQNRYDEAVAAAREAEKLAPESPPLHRTLALWALARGRLDDADAEARRALELSHGGAGALIAVGRVALERGRDAEAADAFAKAVAAWPADWGSSDYAHFLLGSALRRLGRADEAARELARGKPEPPQLPDPWRGEVAELREGFAARLMRARNVMHAGGVAQAIDALEELRKRRPDHAQLLSDLGTAYLLASRPNDAIAVLEGATKAHPTELNPRLLLSLALSAAGRRDEAMREAQAAIDANPASGAAVEARGMIHLRAGRAVEALADFETACRLDPAGASSPALAGAARISLDDLDAARASFERALAVDSTQTTAVAGLAILAIRRGDLAAADDLLARIEGQPDAAAVLVAKARAERAAVRR